MPFRSRDEFVPNEEPSILMLSVTQRVPYGYVTSCKAYPDTPAGAAARLEDLKQLKAAGFAVDPEEDLTGR